MTLDRRGFMERLASGILVATVPPILTSRKVFRTKKVFRMGTVRSSVAPFCTVRAGDWHSPLTWLDGVVPPTFEGFVELRHRVELRTDLTLSILLHDGPDAGVALVGRDQVISYNYSTPALQWRSAWRGDDPRLSKYAPFLYRRVPSLRHEPGV